MALPIAAIITGVLFTWASQEPVPDGALLVGGITIAVLGIVALLPFVRSRA